MPGAVHQLHQQHGNKRRESTADHASDLIAHSGSAIAVCRAEQLGKHRLLHADQHVVRHISQHDGKEDNHHRVTALERHEKRYRAGNTNQCPRHVDPPSAKAISQISEAWDRDTAHCAHQQADVQEQIP